LYASNNKREASAEDEFGYVSFSIFVHLRYMVAWILSSLLSFIFISSTT